MRHISSPTKPIWIPLAAPEGYEFEIDISRPAGALRHRLLPEGQWRPGPAPVEPGNNAGSAPAPGQRDRLTGT